MGLDELKLGGNVDIGQNKILGCLKDSLKWSILEGKSYEEINALQR